MKTRTPFGFQATELAPEMAARTPVDAAVDAVAEGTCEVEEIQALLHPTSAMQVGCPILNRTFHVRKTVACLLMLSETLLSFIERCACHK